MSRTLVGFALGAVFLAALVFMTIRESGVECEVCIAFGGRQVCETAAAPDRKQAQMQATSSACSQLSGGVTQGIQCNQSAPVSIRCSE